MCGHYTTNPKILVLGHGWRMWENKEEPRCAPMELDEWNAFVQNAKKESLVFMDFCESQEPDIINNIGNDWKPFIKPKTFDMVIDAVSHLATTYRRSIHYWEGVKHALKDNGTYIGWNDALAYSSNVPRNSRFTRFNRNEIDERVSRLYSRLVVPKKPFKVFSDYM